jgi:hypothetical protein
MRIAIVTDAAAPQVIRLARKSYTKIEARLDELQPDCIHIATEGPMGLAARRYCVTQDTK